VLLWRRVPEAARPVAAQRFSRLALWCFVLVAASGLVNGALRLGGWSGLATRYGVLLLLKATLLAVLGGLGWWHRRRTLPQLVSGLPHAFERFAGVETVLLAVTVGLGAALARSAPPQPAVPPANPTLAQSLTGYPMPPEPNAARWLTLWQPDLLWLTIGALAVGWYLWATLTLHRRGDRWPVLRTVCWVLGWAVVTWSTSGAPAAYGRVSFSGHMVGHMVLSMVAPMLLVPAAPITLALRTTAVRHDDTRGVREWLLALLESRCLRILSRPVVAAVLFVGSLTAFYYSALFELALRTHVGHELMHVHFLFAGFLFVSVLIGVDPLPYQAPYPIRLLVLFGTMTFHAFFGVDLMMGRTVLAPSYFEALGRTWGGSLLADQQAGGGFAWALGDLPTLAVALILAVQWARSDDREAKRLDRAADRDGDAELKAYNEMLARMAEHDRRRS
jgi:cytochrome c oxidase assembly factor CtaG